MRSSFRSSLFYCVLFCALISSCSTCSRDNAMNEINRLKDSLNATIEGEMMRAEMRQARKEELHLMIDTTVIQDFRPAPASFDYSAIVHKTWNGKLDLNRNGLMAVVYKESGEIALLSTLPGGHSKLHNRVEIEIAGTTYKVDSNDTYPLTVPYQGHAVAVTEAKGEVLYIPEEQALKIMEAMDANPDAEITVRTYHNDELYTSYTLTEDDKNAIIASLKLSRMIKELAELEAQEAEFDD